MQNKIVFKTGSQAQKCRINKLKQSKQNEQTKRVNENGVRINILIS